MIGLLRVTLAFPICAPTNVGPSCLAYLKDGLRTLFKKAFSSRSLIFFIILTSWYLRIFSIVLPYTDTFKSLKKSLRNVFPAFLASLRFSVLKDIYGLNQLV